MIEGKCPRTDAHVIGECSDYTPLSERERVARHFADPTSPLIDEIVEALPRYSDAARIERRVTPRQPKSVIR